MKSKKSNCLNGFKVDDSNNRVFPFFDDDTRKSIDVDRVMQSCYVCRTRFPVATYHNHLKECESMNAWKRYLEIMDLHKGLVSRVVKTTCHNCNLN